MFTAGIKLRFNESLNDFVRPALRHIEISHVLERKASIKDVIESFNVPHTEIELILVNGSAVDFSHIVQDGDDIQVYPTRQTLNSAELPLLRPPLLQPPKIRI